jgi:RNA polymerase sigma factor (sigma-70 family)
VRPPRRAPPRRDVQAPPTDESSAPAWEALAREPTPAEAALPAETVERLLGGLEPRQRQVAQLSLQGETVAQISARLRVTERTAQRVLQRVRERLQRRRAGPESP